MINSDNDYFSGNGTISPTYPPRARALSLSLPRPPGYIPEAGWHVELTEPTIWGWINFGGFLWTPPSNAGMPGYILSTDGNGNLSWVPGTGTGTVTSVDVSGGMTGLTFTGGPVVSAGTITMGGTLGIANGGTGKTNASQAFTALAPDQTGNIGKFLTTNGIVASWAAVPSMVYPGAGVAVSNGTGWDASIMLGTGVQNALMTNVGLPGSFLVNGGTLGIPMAGDFTAGIFMWPQFNQNTTGTADNVTGIVQIMHGGTGQTTANNAFNALAPDQTGNGGKFLTTDGANTSWMAVGGGGMVYPSAGVAVSTGTAWDMSITLGAGVQTGLENPVNALNGFITYDGALGAPLSGNFTTGMFMWPTFNQNTTGTADNVTGTVQILHGGTGQTTANDAFNALAPDQTTNAGKFLTTDGTNTSWATVGGGGMVYPGAGVAVSTGTGWDTSITLGMGVQTWLETPTSANLAAAVTDETGTGALVFADNAFMSYTTFTTDVTVNTLTLGIGPGNDSSNCVFGWGAYAANTIGSANVAIGYQSMAANTDGGANVAIGLLSLGSNTSGSSNVAVGLQTLYANTIGMGNTGCGYSAMANNTTGNSNVAIGNETGLGIQTGNYNIAIAGQVFNGGNVGDNNIGIGYNSQYFSQASDNVSIGVNSLNSNIAGINNVCLGNQSLYTNNGSDNVAIGHGAGYDLTSGNGNTIVGAGITGSAGLAGTIILGAATVERIRCNDLGQWLIGTTLNPPSLNTKLLVNGDLQLGIASTKTGALVLYNATSADYVHVQSGVNSANWTLTLPTGPGTAGSFLQTDGAGNTSWASASAPALNWANIYDITPSQTAIAINTATTMTFSSIDPNSNGVSVIAATQIKVANTGIYTFTPSVQVTNTDTQGHDFNMWFAKNGTTIPYSNSKFTIPPKHGSGDGYSAVAVTYTLKLLANEYIEILWSTNDLAVSIITEPASGPAPVAPGIIVSVIDATVSP